MRITLSHYSTELTWEDHDTADLPVVIEGIRGLLVGAGFHPCAVDNCFCLDSSWNIEITKKEDRDANEEETS